MGTLHGREGIKGTVRITCGVIELHFSAVTTFYGLCCFVLNVLGRKVAGVVMMDKVAKDTTI